MCSVNTKTPHVNHQVCSVTCSVNDWKKLSIEVFGPKSSQLGHGFHEPGIMPNIQSRSLETTVLVLLDLTVSLPSGNTVHRQFSTLTPSKDTLSPLSARPCGGGQPPSNAWKPAQSNKTPPCTRFDRLLEHRHDLVGTLFLGEPEIPDLTGQVNPDPHVSTGVSETNTSPTLIREFGSNRLNLHQILQKSDHGKR